MKRTYHYCEVNKCMVEGPAPRKAHSGDGWLYGDRLYSSTPFLAPDGTVIASKKSHREYMARNNLTTVDDYNNTWKSAEAKRADHYTTGGDHRGRREAVERAIAKLEK